MPSIVRRSALMQSRKLALVSQDFAQQDNGLVQVSLSYTAVASDASSVTPLFRVDSQPPMSPSIIDLNSLQTQKLYLTNFSSSQANGLLQINAVYVGASLNALRKPSISDSVERRSISIDIPSFSYSAIKYVNTGSSALQVLKKDPVVQYDRYVIDAHLRNEEQQVATVANEAIDYQIPPVLDTNERSGLLMGATFKSRTFSFMTFGDLQSQVTAFGDPQARPLGTWQYSDKKLPGYEFRSMTALQILQALASASTSKNNAGALVVNTGKIEHVTPSVRLISNDYVLQFNSSEIYSKWGARIR